MEQKEFITADQLDYKKKDYIHPSYELYRIYQQNGGTTASCTVAGGTESIFEIPAKCVNFNRSFLKFQINVPGNNTAGNYKRLFMDCMPTIRQIQLYTRGNVYLCDLQGANNYTKVIWNAETNINDFLEYPTQSYGVAAVGNANNNPGFVDANGVSVGEGSLFERSDDVKKYRAAQAAYTNDGKTAELVATSSDGKAVTGQLSLIIPAADEQGVRSQRLPTGPSNINYTEPQYVMRSTVGAGAGQNLMNVNINLPLGMYKNTILAVDKDLYFNNEVLLLRIVWESSPRVDYINTSAANAEDGKAVETAEVDISNLLLYLAVEQNQQIINSLTEKIKTGFNVMVPFVWTYVNALPVAATLQSVSIRLNRGHGLKLLKIYHALFSTAADANLVYDHSNINGVKASSYYSLLNNNRIQQFDLSTTDLQDYNYLQDYLKDSVLQTPNIYQYNWFHCDNWTNLPAVESDKLDNYDTGVDLEIERKWDIYLTTANAVFNHNTFAIVQRMLSISPSGIVLI